MESTFILRIPGTNSWRYSIMIALLIVLFLRSLLSGKKKISMKLFSAALRNENNGNFEEALVNYETALAEVKKTKHNKNLRTKIIEKIKTLHTVIQYEKVLCNPYKKMY